MFNIERSTKEDRTFKANGSCILYHLHKSILSFADGLKLIFENTQPLPHLLHPDD